MHKNTLLISVILMLIIGSFVAWNGVKDPAMINMETQLDKNIVEEPANYDRVDQRVPQPETPSVPPSKLKAETFTGTLGKVDVGCFADGECFVEVDGKHVTAIMGWSQETVGGVQGVESFGDLESHIGEMVEVYAQVKGDGTYTLYGSEGFYIKLARDKMTMPNIPMEGVACVVSGCSAQLCVDAADGGMASTCEYREEYACYQTAKCERQASGQCGWTETSELKQCLMTKGAVDQKLEVQ